MRARDPSLKSQIEKESIALFKKNLLKESYSWFKDTDYFEKLKSEKKYSNAENERETKNVVTGRVQLGWGGTFFLLCCVVVICDNSGWQSCNHYNNSIFYSPEALTVVYSILFIVYAFPLFILQECLGLLSQGNYVKSCRMLSSHMGVLSIFSLLGTVTFCAKEICNFSVELLQNVLRIVNMRNGEKKYAMTKVFIDLTKRHSEDCALMPDTIYLEAINQCVSFNRNVMVNFYENLWFIGNKENCLYLILIATLFILFCYLILLRENFRVFKFFIFVIIVNWISSKSVVIMNTFFFYIPQEKKLHQEVVQIFQEIGIVKLTIFLYGTIARSSSIFILSTFASYFHTNTNVLRITIYTFAFYILNMYFYLKNEAHEYYLYNSRDFSTVKEFNFMKCNTYINLLQGLAHGRENGGAGGAAASYREDDIPSAHTQDDRYAVWQKLCLFFSSYSFLFSTIFIVLMQLLGPFNILMERGRRDGHVESEHSSGEGERRIYTYKSLVRRYERDRISRSASNNRSSSVSGRGGRAKRGRKNGYKKGHKNIHQNGHKKGHQNGHKSSHQHGHKSSHQHGHKSSHQHGHKNSHQHGHKNSHQHGHKNSHQNCHPHCHQTDYGEKKKKFPRFLFFKGGEEAHRERHDQERSLYLSRKSSLLPEKGNYSQAHSSALSNLQNGGEEAPDELLPYKCFDGEPGDFNFGGSSFEDDIGVADLAGEDLQGKKSNRRRRQSSTSAHRKGSSSMYADSELPSWGARRDLLSASSGSSAGSSEAVEGGGARWSGEGASGKGGSGKGISARGRPTKGSSPKGGSGRGDSGKSISAKTTSARGITGTVSPTRKNTLHRGIAALVEGMKNRVMNKYGTFLLFAVIYVFTILHVMDFRRNKDIVSEIILNSLYRGFLIFICAVQVIYASWLFGMKLQMAQCGVISCLLNFFSWVVVLPLVFVIYFREGSWLQMLIIGLSLNVVAVATSFLEVTLKLRRGTAEKRQRYSYAALFKKCLYWLYIGNLEVLRRNMNIAMSGQEEKYIPLFWSFFLKYINSSMLVVVVIYNTREYFFKMLPMFGGSFSFRIELGSIVLIFLGSLAVLAGNLRRDHYRPQTIGIPPVPMFCQDKRRYIFAS
ncbi:hypothetical protein, conserved [Plasmodium vivax]|uniref:Transporter n=1 Tax=Plasmodium vivax (strain Salvador I) TaxID=126793 RepID=A5K7S0_PLAVS|nr:hypothetical protein, conserved [Plasmodium vivax]EDL44829.1 hypothetical protein, conserved [Plasmodium vivax]|eukprot:XP_001614556.1 hypothetical protein [Plasmodium vivax Sal-1]